jgi:hypothetical protein
MSSIGQLLNTWASRLTAADQYRPPTGGPEASI